MAGNVNLIDPIDANINTNIVNSIPEYQDMFINVELTAVKRGRTILTTNVDGNLTRLDEDSTTGGRKISFLGENQNNNNPNYGRFTTNYYDGSVEDPNVHYEGFGISSINILTNSSYIPEINIEFIDVRGLAFFNRENSPYRILFDFPPPIFYLTIKGYYGKAITYQMHLVKYTNDFKSDTGNFHIDAKFIAITYAPLTDVLFRYIVQAPLLNKDPDQTLTSKTNVEPKNTLDLILKLQNVYSTIPEKVKTDVDNERYEDSRKQLNILNDKIQGIGSISQNNILTRDSETPIFFTYDNTPDSTSQSEIRVLNNLTTFNDILSKYSTSEIPVNIRPRLFIGYESGKVILDESGNVIGSAQTRENILIDRLNEYKEEFLLNFPVELDFVIDENQLPNAIVLNYKSSTTNQNEVIRYVGLDVSNYYGTLYKERNKIEENKSVSANRMNEKINNMIQENLGMKPTIYNIFRIILNDVDTFFQKLREVSISAEQHHETYSNQIINDGNYEDTSDKIYSFPLVVKEEILCKNAKKTRTVPNEISSRLDQPFPEIKLVQEFIDTFIDYNRVIEQARLKSDRVANGDYRWIPITPLDSKLLSFNQNSPYYGVDPLSSDDQSISFSEDPKLNEIFRILLDRYYILTQNVFPYTYFNINESNNLTNSGGGVLYENKNNDVYIRLYAESEAINLVNSMISEDILSLLKRYSSLNKSENLLNNQENGFYAYLENQLPNVFDFQEEVNFLNVANSGPLYIDKSDPNYEGLRVISLDLIAERTGSGDEYDPFYEFIEKSKVKWTDLIFKGVNKNKETDFVFTQRNLIFRPDNLEGEIQSNGESLKTKFLLPGLWIRKINNSNDLIFTAFAGETPVGGFENNQTRPFPEVLNNLSTDGNKHLFDVGVGNVGLFEKRTSEMREIHKLWANILTFNGDDIFNDVINIDNLEDPIKRRMIAILYLSNFGNTLSPFNYYPFALNRDFFTTPSIIETPAFVSLYLGSLLDIEVGSDVYNELYNFFTEGSGTVLDNGGALIFADIHDVNNILSENDKQRFRKIFDDFYTSTKFTNFVKNIYNLYTEVIESEAYQDCLDIDINIADRRNSCINKLFIDALNVNGRYFSIIKTLIEREGIVVFNEITFRLLNDLNTTTYQSLNVINSLPGGKEFNDKYFSLFFQHVNKLIDDRQEELQQQEEEFRRSTGDEDITNQMYYSFKNINDKWLAGMNKNSVGYPFKNNPRGSLIDQFAFVDRTMKPIGDTIINPEILINVLDDPSISIFTVLSQLLSLNGFEFFPLQNFLSFTEGEWEDSFRINTGSLNKQFPVFVCMYIGGSSSYPTGINNFNDFVDDGIIDLDNPGVPDFNGEDCEPNQEDDNQIETTENSADIYNQVRAFRVRYGEQNQSMFYDISIDSKEYPETNESIQILSRLAGDNKENAPIPKGQNLYNLYENRSYKATIVGFGNAMIQPTQYFQLENVPLYNGAYVVLSVEHEIIPNKMTTKFSGTKILKYPIPRVLNPASIVGFDGGSSTETNSREISDNDILEGVGTSGNPEKAKYNALYSLEIR